MIKANLIATLGITSILVLAFFLFLYLLGLNSEPYKVVLDFIDNNTMLSEDLGHLESKRLYFFGYSVRYDGPTGYAEYKLSVKGQKGEGIVYVELKKTLGQWKVLQANLVYDNNVKPLTENKR